MVTALALGTAACSSKPAEGNAAANAELGTGEADNGSDAGAGDLNGSDNGLDATNGLEPLDGNATNGSNTAD